MQLCEEYDDRALGHGQPLDWCCGSSSTVIEKVVKAVEEDDIILLHDASESSVEAALGIIDALEKQGYEFVTVDEVIFE